MAKKAPHRRSRLEPELFANRYTEADVAKVIKRSVPYISNRFNGRGSFTIDEAYKLLELLGREPEEIFTFFPPEQKGRYRRNEKD